jgi:uncharacterized protein (TIGR02246 family)
MNKILLFFSIMLVTLIFSCGKSIREDRKMQTFDKEREEAAIRAVEKSYDTAWHNGNIEGLMELITDSIVVVNPFGQSASGKIEFRRMLVEFLNGPGKDTKHTSTILRVNFITDNFAMVDGKAIIDNPSINTNLNNSSLTHYFTDLLVKQNETWAIAAIRAYTFITEKPSVEK